MTLTVAINLDDYVFIAGDHRLIIQSEPYTGSPDKIVVDDYKKIRYWEHGAITVSGDVLLMHYFHEILELYAKKNCWDFLEIAQVARAIYLNDGNQVIRQQEQHFFHCFH